MNLCNTFPFDLRVIIYVLIRLSMHLCLLVFQLTHFILFHGSLFPGSLRNVALFHNVEIPQRSEML